MSSRSSIQGSGAIGGSWEGADEGMGMLKSGSFNGELLRGFRFCFWIWGILSKWLKDVLRVCCSPLALLKSLVEEKYKVCGTLDYTARRACYTPNTAPSHRISLCASCISGIRS